MKNFKNTIFIFPLLVALLLCTDLQSQAGLYAGSISIAQKVEAYQKNDFLYSQNINYAASSCPGDWLDDLAEDLSGPNGTELKTYFDDNSGKVKLWEIIRSGSDDVSRAVRSNPANLDIVDEYLFEYPSRVEEVRTGFAVASNKQQYIDDLLGPAPHGSRDVRHRVRGHFEGIVVNDNLGGRLTDDSYGSGLVTYVSPETPNGKRGEFVRAYNPSKKEFQMQVAFAEDAPGFLQGTGIPLVQGTGTPTQMYVTLRQLRMLDIPHGEIETLRMSDIENKETLLWLASIIKQNNGITNFSQVGDLILSSPHGVAGYAITTMKQAGYRSVSAQIVDEVGSAYSITIGELMNRSEFDIKPEDLVKYDVELKPTDETFIDFDIILNLVSF